MGAESKEYNSPSVYDIQCGFMNELIFFSYIAVVSLSALIALGFGKEALVGLICIYSILINLFAMKKIQLFGFTATASDALAVGITLSLNLIQEYYDRSLVRRAIWIGFFCSAVYVVLSVLHLAFIPAPDDFSQVHFTNLLEPMPRVILASLFVFILVQYADSAIYGLLRRYFQGKFYVLRNYGSLAVSQLLDTVLFSFLGLYHLNDNYRTVSTMCNIIVVSYAIKLITVLSTTPFLVLSRRFAARRFNLTPSNGILPTL